jgi:hypothetical protein
MNECLFYGYSASNNLVRALDSVTSWHFFNASLEMMTFVHKAPVMIDRCWAVKDAYEDVKNIYRWWTWQDSQDSLVALTANLLLNSGDVLVELQVMQVAFFNGDFS